MRANRMGVRRRRLLDRIFELGAIVKTLMGHLNQSEVSCRCSSRPLR
jgi:hypothetical protein